MYDFLVTAIQRTEINNHVSGKSTTWDIHVVSPDDPDVEVEIKLWGDMSTDDAEIAARFQPGQRWTLSPR